MLTLAKMRRFFLDVSFSWEANFQRPPLIFEHEELHNGHGSTLEDDFGMGDVKGEDNSIWGASHCRSSSLPLRRVDPYCRSQLLVEYSKDLGACMILDDSEGYDRYMVVDEVIHSYGRVFLTRVSELKRKILHAAHVDFLSMHFVAHYPLMEEFTLEVIQKDLYQHMGICIA